MSAHFKSKRLALRRYPRPQLHGNTAQPFPRLPRRDPGHRRGPGHPGGGEHGGGGRGADAQPAGSPELRHPQRHGVSAGSYQDRQGELSNLAIEHRDPALRLLFQHAELLPNPICEGCVDALS